MCGARTRASPSIRIGVGKMQFPLPGEKIGAHIVDAIRSAGITRVTTCEDARTFIRIEYEVVESEPYSAENDAWSDRESPLPGATFDEESSGSNAEADVEK